MTKTSHAILFCLLIVLSFGGYSQSVKTKSNLELDSLAIAAEHNLEMPVGTISFEAMTAFEMGGHPFAFVTYYSNPYIHLYDLTTDSLVGKIYQHNIAIKKIGFFNADSIMVYGSPVFGFNNDSIIRCINIKGEIKHVYPLSHPNIISSRNSEDNLMPNHAEMYPIPQFIHDNKIFVKFDYCYYGLKGYGKKLPIIGYYDLKKDTLVTIDNIWYPFLKEGVYYKRRFYKPNIALKSDGNILISFAYTPTFYEWNSKTNRLDTHFVTSKYMNRIPYSTNLFVDENEYDDPSYKEGFIGAVSSTMYATNKSHPSHVHTRSIFLPTPDNWGIKSICVYFDNKYTYCGESFMRGTFGEEYDGKYVNGSIRNGKFRLVFFRPAFKPFDETSMIAKMDSFAKMDLEKEKKRKNEICRISGNNQSELFSYQKNDIIKYLEKTQQIVDTSFSVVIVNSAGCGSCNQYILQVLKQMQTMFFNMQSRPMYMLYVKENGSIEEVESYLGEYLLFDGRHVKKDVSTLYKSFHPFQVMNPRLVLVSNNQVMHDNVYLPNEMEALVDDLLKYYGLSEE